MCVSLSHYAVYEQNMTKDIQTTWDLSKFYTATDDPQIEKDLEYIEEEYAAFAKKYRDDRSYLKDPRALKTALEEYEELPKDLNPSKPLYYFSYRKSLDSDDQEAEAMVNKLSQQLSKISNKVLFFELTLGNVSEKTQKKFLKTDELSEFHYYLERLFIEARHNLSEPEEKILNLTSLPRYGMWVSGVNKAVNRRTVEFNGEHIPLSEAHNKVSDLPTEKRRKLQDDITGKLHEVHEFAESELNAVITNKKISDELRGYKYPYSATIQGYENDEESVMAMVQTITDRFDISHRFYDIKRTMLDLDYLAYADRNAKVGETEAEISFDEAVNTLRSVFGSADKQFQDILDRFLAEGQIDVFPRQGKDGGAYCSGAIDLPTLVLLNYVPNFESLRTFGHEMGHAIHSELSKKQRPLYEDYTISVAEVASTFCEQLVFDHVFKTLSDEDKIVALHDKINASISAIFRQIALFNFEIDLHHGIREQGNMSHDEIVDVMNTHMQAYLGDHFNLTDRDGCFYIMWGHIRRPFYVYAYAYGEIIARALYEKYTEDKAYVKNIKQFLSAGGSKQPKDIFADIGIDTTDPDFFANGLRLIEREIEELENLI